jgi:hypothetical protein
LGRTHDSSPSVELICGVIGQFGDAMSHPRLPAASASQADTALSGARTLLNCALLVMTSSPEYSLIALMTDAVRLRPRGTALQ